MKKNFSNYKIKILFVHPGSSNKESYIKNALDYYNINYDIFHCSEFTEYYAREINFKNIINKLFDKFFIPIDTNNANSKLIKFYLKKKYDVVIFQKNNLIKPSTYKQIHKNSKVISFYDDNFLKFHNLSIYYIFSIKYFNYLITIYRDNYFNYISSILLKNNSKLFLDFPSINILKNSKKIKNKINNKILFIGIATADRYKKILDLSRNGFTIDVYGAYWDRFFKKKVLNINVFYKTVTGIKYLDLISKYKIVLPFPREENSDLLNYKCAEILYVNGILIVENNFLSQNLKKYFDNVFLYNNSSELIQIIAEVMNNDYKINLSKNKKIYFKLNMFFESRLLRVLNDI